MIFNEIFLHVFFLVLFYHYHAQSEPTDKKVYNASTHSKSMVDIRRKFHSYLAICACLRDEELDIKEWIEYHRLMGVSKFYIYDNNSTSPASHAVMFPYLKTGLVEYSFVTSPQKPNSQVYINTHCLRHHKDQHHFIAIIDIDEFIVVNGTRTIPQVLKNFEQYGGLTLNWMWFGNSGHIKRPEGGILPNYWMCGPNFRVKSVVNTKYVDVRNPRIHDFDYKPGYFAVDTNRRKQVGPFNPKRDGIPNTSLYYIMYINHYAIKSLEDFQRKCNRGAGDGQIRSMEYFERVNNISTQMCPILRMPTYKPIADSSHMDSSSMDSGHVDTSHVDK